MSLMYNDQPITHLMHNGVDLFGGGSSGIESLDGADETVEVTFSVTSSFGSNPYYWHYPIVFSRFGNLVLVSFPNGFSGNNQYAKSNSTPQLPESFRPKETVYIIYYYQSSYYGGYVIVDTDGYVKLGGSDSPLGKLQKYSSAGKITTFYFTA